MKTDQTTVVEAMPKPQVLANNPEQLDLLRKLPDVERYFAAGSLNWLICVDMSCSGKDVVPETNDNEYPIGKFSQFFSNKTISATEFVKTKEVHRPRVLLLFTGLTGKNRRPINIEILNVWKGWLSNTQKLDALEVKIDFWREGNFDEDYVRGRIFRHCTGWLAPDPQSRDVTLWVRGLVKIDSKKDDSMPMTDGLTAVMFGATQDVITRLERVRKRFIDQFGKIIVDHSVKIEGEDCDYCGYVCKKLQHKDTKKITADNYWLRKVRVTLPKLLLRGESGVGKTFAARLVDDFKKSEEKVPLTRISIPEFIGKESEFEYALFGYAPGSYTGALAEGSPGLLLKNTGRVVYLDEIGEANATLQAKLLAYLDDYLVRPRGWLEEPFFAPTFIVAGTNRNLEQMAETGAFRRDLLARFTDIETIPPLRERRESLDFILDCLLQQPDINPDDHIKGITGPAHNRLKYYDYAKGNFRELEDILRTACWRARNSGRSAPQNDVQDKDAKSRDHYIYECDLEGLL